MDSDWLIDARKGKIWIQNTLKEQKYIPRKNEILTSKEYFLPSS